MAYAFRLEENDHKIALLTFDQPGTKVNVLSQRVFEELAALLAELQHRQDLRGLLLRSGKRGQFVAGVDLNELAALTRLGREEVAAFVARGQEVFDHVGRLPFPSVALIDGPCLGGGTEYALVADYRIASDNPRTRIGLPEVSFGILPGWGATQLLPRLIDVAAAIEMICSGEPIVPSRAEKLGLLSQVVPAEQLIEKGCWLIQRVQESRAWEEDRRRRRGPVSLSGEQLRAICACAESGVMQKTRGQNLGPLTALRVIQQGCSLPLEEGLKLEQEAFLDLMGTPIPANLLAVFFMKQRLARDPGFSAPGVPARHTQKVGVLGAGLTGSGIAAVHASSGIPTVLVDPDQERMAHGLVGLRTIMVEQIISGRAVPQDMAGMLDQLNTSPALEILADCDLVIETIPGDEAFHRELYQALAAVLGSGTILASNTSTLSITPLARSAPHAERFLGIHFFHPVHRMQLVEVVRGETTTDETIATAVALARRLGKTPIVVHDGTGFLINRILFSYLNEAVLLLLEGAAQAAIDQAATRFGMPMGPLLLHDVIGLDTVCSIHGALLKAYGNRTVPLPILADLAAGGRLGQKSGAGFRKYDTAHRKGVPDPDFRPYLERHRIDHRDISDDEITNRLFLSMLLEATRALEENIAREPAHVDMGLILGTGFPAFRGGILRWCDTEGVGRIMQRVSKYYSLGKRFQPTAILERLAGSAGRFYS